MGRREVCIDRHWAIPLPPHRCWAIRFPVPLLLAARVTDSIHGAIYYVQPIYFERRWSCMPVIQIHLSILPSIHAFIHAIHSIMQFIHLSIYAVFKNNISLASGQVPRGIYLTSTYHVLVPLEHGWRVGRGIPTSTSR